jgi:digeranylgeranylglycerophospholipid reductase
MTVQTFDVVVIGAGPAGGQCARKLAQADCSVLVVEQHPDFATHDFSSGGTPLETLERFDLPVSVVGQYWSKLAVQTSQEAQTWTSDCPLGAVLNFAKLRRFLIEEVQRLGGQVWMNCRYLGLDQTAEGVTLELYDRGDRQTRTVQASVVVDATGPARVVMQPYTPASSTYLEGIGIEYLIEVSPETYARFSDTLAFYLGHAWMPKGYSWIFPMESGKLKVGTCWFKRPHKLGLEATPAQKAIDLLLQKEVGDNYRLLDVHGAALKYSETLRDVYHHGRAIAIGDAVSAVNFLGGEGIRHGMVSAEIAAQHILKSLRANRFNFNAYERAIRRRFDLTWKLTARLGLKKYLADPDWKIDRIVRYVRHLETQDLMDVLFEYKFQRVSKRLLRYLWLRLRSRFFRLA